MENEESFCFNCMESHHGVKWEVWDEETHFLHGLDEFGNFCKVPTSGWIFDDCQARDEYLAETKKARQDPNSQIRVTAMSVIEVKEY